MVMEIAKEDLFELSRKIVFREEYLKRLFHQLCLAIKYLHDRNIIHRDLKLENILLTDQFEPKLIDFGWSCTYNPSRERRSVSGTKEYNAPEILKKENQTKAVDIWALGLILYELHHSHLPFEDPEQYLSQEVPWKQSIDPKARDLISKCLVRNPK